MAQDRPLRQISKRMALREISKKNVYGDVENR